MGSLNCTLKRIGFIKTLDEAVDQLAEFLMYKRQTLDPKLYVSIKEFLQRAQIGREITEGNSAKIKIIGIKKAVNYCNDYRIFKRTMQILFFRRTGARKEEKRLHAFLSHSLTMVILGVYPAYGQLDCLWEFLLAMSQIHIDDVREIVSGQNLL